MHGFKATGFAILLFIGAIKALDELFKDAEFGGFGVEIFQSDDGFVLEIEAILLGELMGQLIDRAAVGDEEQVNNGVFEELGIDLLEILQQDGPSGLGISFQTEVLGGDDILFGDIGEDDIAPLAGDADIGFIGDKVAGDMDG